MNEQITKIVIGTLGKEGVVNSRAFGHWALSDEELEKFAELIVRECSNVAWQYTPDTEELEYSHLIKDKILEHFGVEE